MLPVQFQTWGDAMLASVSQALAIFLAAIPKVIGFAIILIVGWFLASVIARAVAAILRTVRFEELANRSGFADFVKGTGVETDASGFLALISKWFIRLLTMVVAFDALGLPAVSDVLRQMLLWLPNLVVGLVVLVIGGLIANALAGIVRGASMKAGLSNPDALANVARVAIWGFAIVVAVNQIGIAQTLINTLFMAIVGAVALAAGLAFGLGGRDTAGEMVREWRDRMRNASPQLSAAGQEVAREVERQVPRQNGDYPNR